MFIDSPQCTYHQWSSCIVHYIS